MAKARARPKHRPVGGKKRATSRPTTRQKPVRTRATSTRATRTPRSAEGRQTAARAKRRGAQAASAQPLASRPDSPITPDTPFTSAAAAVGRVLGRTVEAVTHFPFGNDGDALRLLEHDHRRLETLLKQGEGTTERAIATRARLLETLSTELQMHEAIEEKVLYPALKPHAEAVEIVLEGYQEHHVADVLIRELQALAPDDERWGAKFKVLKENIEHHIEEEEGEMFTVARSVLSRAEREKLGARMRAMKVRS